MKCSTCGARWRALPEGTAPPAEPEAEAAPSVPPDEAAPADIEVVDVRPEPEPAPFAPPPFRPTPIRAVAAERRQGRARAFGWAVAAVIVIALVASAILLRGQVVRLWPRSQAAYAGLGLPVQSLGLVIEAVRVEPAFEGGRPVLSVTGSIRNVRDEAVEAPPLRINLLNRAGKPVAAKLARPLDGRIPARAQRHFAIAISDPPANAQDLEVSFDGGPVRRASAIAGATAAPPAPPEPLEAQPLAPGTPESLSEHG